MILFNKEQIYIGNSMQELKEVREALKKEGIKYTYKVTDLSLGAGTTKGMYGSCGINMDYQNKQYIVSVKKKDSEKAKSIINRVLLR